MLTQPTPPERQAFSRLLAKERLRRYRSLFGGDDAKAVELYLLDLELAAELHGLIGVLETSMREAMHRELSRQYGADWVRQRLDLFDDRNRGQLEEATGKAGSNPSVGKIIAETTLGLWSTLLGPGGFAGQGPSRVKKDYENQLWYPALAASFPHGAPGRHAVAELAQRLRFGRNRVAHYEPLIFGVPQTGRRTSRGTRQRQHPSALLRDIRQLAGHLDPTLESWLRRCDLADNLIAEPLAQVALASVAKSPDVILLL